MVKILKVKIFVVLLIISINIYFFILPNNYTITEKVSDISCGYWHSVVVKSNGSIWGWGANWYDQIGVEGKDLSERPMPVFTLPGAIAISCGSNHTICLEKDGSVLGWGNNNNGQLGDGTNVSSAKPKRVLGIDHVIAIASGDSYSIALKSDGTVWAWGYNYKYQLGNGTKKNSLIPIKIKSLSKIIAISSGHDHCLALSKDGTVYAWGNNSKGQLGNDSTSETIYPTKVVALSEVTAVSCGGYHSAAITKDGSLYLWGDNSNGQLGDGTTKTRLEPTKVRYLENISAIACGDGHSIALMNDHTLFSWGGNAYGQLGDGTRTARAIPKRIKNMNSIILINAKNNFNLAVNSDCSVFSWGDNFAGQLGIGTRESHNMPVRCLLNKIDKNNYDNNINADKFYSKQNYKNVIIGVLDTGIDTSHNDIHNTIYVNSKEIPNNSIDDDGNGYIDDINGWDFANNDNSVYDDQGDRHGTLVAGILANNIKYVESKININNVKILPLKYMSNNSGYINNIIEAIDYAYLMGARIINCSFGKTEYNPILEEIIRDSGMIFVCSAGNNSDDLSLNPTFPACFNLANILCVAAIDNYGDLSNFTNYGEYIKIVGPGVNIKSTLPNNSYGTCSGSSFVAPYTSCAVAILCSGFPNAENSEILSLIEDNTIKTTKYECMATDCGKIDIDKIISLLEK